MRFEEERKRSRKTLAKEVVVVDVSLSLLFCT